MKKTYVEINSTLGIFSDWGLYGKEVTPWEDFREGLVWVPPPLESKGPKNGVPGSAQPEQCLSVETS